MKDHTKMCTEDEIETAISLLRLSLETGSRNAIHEAINVLVQAKENK
jgi:hypothetical protein